MLGKQLELLSEAAPNALRVAFLAPRPETPADARWHRMIGSVGERLGRTVAIALLDSPIREPEYRRAFGAMAAERVQALFVPDYFEHIESDEGNVTADPAPLRKHGLNALVPIAGDRLAVEDGRRDGPHNLPKPRHVGMPQEFAPGPAESMDGAPLADMELNSLPVELRFAIERRSLRRSGSVRRSHSMGGIKGTATTPGSMVPGARRLKAPVHVGRFTADEVIE